MKDNIADELIARVKEMIDNAQETGEEQSFSFSTGGWQDIIRNGKKVGRYRIQAADITIAPAKKTKRRKSQSAAPSAGGKE